MLSLALQRTGESERLGHLIKVTPPLYGLWCLKDLWTIVS